MLMVDEMYLKKHHNIMDGGNYVREDSSGELYKGIVVFMIAGVKKVFLMW